MSETSESKDRGEMPEAAKRALAEAKERRRQREAEDARLADEKERETGGPKGMEPTRFGDWERKGITYDF